MESDINLGLSNFVILFTVSHRCVVCTEGRQDRCIVSTGLSAGPWFILTVPRIFLLATAYLFPSALFIYSFRVKCS